MSLPAIAAWNVRGFNNPVKAKLCKDLIASYGLKFLCILEAKIQPHVTIWLKWDSSQISFSPLFTSSQVVHGILDAGSLPPIYLSVVYAANELVDRKALWDNLLGFAGMMDHPWIVMGDFNCCRYEGKKLAGIRCRLIDWGSSTILFLELVYRTLLLLGCFIRGITKEVITLFIASWIVCW
ncbi:hypothetical protein KFK09_022334 [Dendrobium nobile]|uniref:Endonuclease/exonuclease/phosphatase domain-containing protein n=1 Tax=Dendrobium nobile TaxID=94219 RepID=A0A8T3AIA5_DENNO|nr:hypothetical protein KFK09_022334 [Dendrobium nobile]